MRGPSGLTCKVVAVIVRMARRTAPLLFQTVGWLLFSSFVFWIYQTVKSVGFVLCHPIRHINFLFTADMWCWHWSCGIEVFQVLILKSLRHWRCTERYMLALWCVRHPPLCRPLWSNHSTSQKWLFNVPFILQLCATMQWVLCFAWKNNHTTTTTVASIHLKLKTIFWWKWCNTKNTLFDVTHPPSQNCDGGSFSDSHFWCSPLCCNQKHESTVSKSISEPSKKSIC